ncbi:uncharacterized protein LOC132269469 isoform X3 [Cornus florida]|uniref:uncharacterized protein LOC132269469 isoform X3 n=1 Tax=Cornus florida TaxID=4283 RepID=UPI00289FA847|nr:uncharacterized protein LOC132269469 isoform X3 [Cornus florida]
MVATMKRHALTLTEFDQHLQFSFCRSCEAHIALQSDFAGADTTYSKAIFLDAVNVVIDGPNRHRTEGTNKVADVHCTRCNTLLGSQYLETPKDVSEQEDLDRFSTSSVSGMEALLWLGNNSTSFKYTDWSLHRVTGYQFEGLH